jgi:hypothetical protein
VYYFQQGVVAIKEKVWWQVFGCKFMHSASVLPESRRIASIPRGFSAKEINQSIEMFLLEAS